MDRRPALRRIVIGSAAAAVVRDGRLVYVWSACQNPTLTMMALAARACDYLVEELRAERV